MNSTTKFHPPGATRRCLIALAFACGVLTISSAGELEDQLAALVKQNEALMALAQTQQAQIAELKARMDSIEDEGARQEQSIVEMQADLEMQEEVVPATQNGGGRIQFSGDIGVAFFAGDENNAFPNEEFRIDDARLNIEAEVVRGVYFVSTLELFRRESGNEAVELGSVYVDFENVFGLTDYDRLFNLRVGRFDIPFGHEYTNRYVMENPLISHSVSDLWGIDQGVEMYGQNGAFSYVVALQNGGTPLLRDFDKDKSLVVRFGYDVTNDFNVSASFMRTGDLDTVGDKQSELWIGNVVFLTIGSAQTSKFEAELSQIDFDWSWETGELLGYFGTATYSDNDPLGNNTRDFDFYSLEARQYLNDKLYAAARYSVMDVDGGYPFSGNGSRGIYLFGGTLTEKLERISVGLGYWAFDDVLFKVEYSKEDGKQTDGNKREGSDQLAAELGVRF